LILPLAASDQHKSPVGHNQSLQVFGSGRPSGSWAVETATDDLAAAEAAQGELIITASHAAARGLRTIDDVAHCFLTVNW
jgi:hypothetical protein